jgi:GntR family transcriptional regulator
MPRKNKHRRTAAKSVKATKVRRAGTRTPLYRKVLQTLKERILSGTYAVGMQLPTENQLAVEIAVSRHTIRAALRQLRDDGLVSSRQGAGTTVRRQGVPEPYVHEVASISDLVAYSSETQYRADSSEIVAADEPLAQRLDCVQNERWLRIEGLRYAPGKAEPLARTEVFVAGPYAGVARLLGRRPGPIYSWVEDLYGERVSEVEQRIAAKIVPPEFVHALQVEPGSAAVEIRRTYRLGSGAVALIAFNLYPADRFSYSMTMRRVRRESPK